MLCLVQSPCKQARKCALKSNNPPLFLMMAMISSAPDSNPTQIAEAQAMSSALVEELGL